MSSIWQNCLVHLQDRISPTEFSTWIRPLQADINADSINLYAPNRFVLSWVQDKYLEQISELIKYLTQNENFCIKLHEGSMPVSKSVTTENNNQAKNNSNKHSQKKVNNSKTPGNYESYLNNTYTFASFVEGKSNRLACSIAKQVADNPGSKQFNPFFLYGGTGLGKTHLLHAIGNEILRMNPNASVIYIHSERFVQEMVRAIKGDYIEKFKNFFRSANALLIDDIQFFASKEGSQQEFFHTFNALFELGRQIILTSDRFPKEIDKIEDRLKSRFGWGLSIAIDPPDLETRVAILLKKAEMNNIVLPEEVAFFIGQRLPTNVRELEGALNRVNAYAGFTGKPITMDFVYEALKDMLAAQDKLVTIDNIQKIVAEYYKIRVSDLKSKSRARSVARPRQLAMTLAKELTNRSLIEIGRAFGDRDHTTVLHACRTITSLRGTDSNIEEDFNNLIRTLSS